MRKIKSETDEQYEWFLSQQDGPTIDAKPPGYFARWRKAKFSHQLAAVLILGFLLPMGILIVGIFVLGVWSAITRP